MACTAMLSKMDLNAKLHRFALMVQAWVKEGSADKDAALLQCLSMLRRVAAAAGFWRVRPLKIQYLKIASMTTGTTATKI